LDAEQEVTVTSAGKDRLRALIDGFAPDVGAFLRRRSYPLQAADIEELVQAVFVVAWRRIDEVPSGQELPWLIGVARNVLNNARRSHSRRRALLSRVRPVRDEPSAEDLVTASEELKRTFRSLGRSDREILLLHFWEGLEAPELAVALGIRQGAASTRLSRATSRLRANYLLAGQHAVKTESERT
jgi:RNA polymerase sigma-70 factor (ECF subfamily)